MMTCFVRTKRAKSESSRHEPQSIVGEVVRSQARTSLA